MRKLSAALVPLMIVAVIVSSGCDNTTEPTDNGLQTYDYERYDLDSNLFKLSNHKGKVVLNMFFLTTCPVCAEEAPILNEIYTQLKDSGLVVTGISIEPRTSLAAYRSAKSIQYPILLDNNQAVHQVYGVSQVPHFVIFDRNAKIRVYDVAQPNAFTKAEILAAVRPLLKESYSPSSK